MPTYKVIAIGYANSRLYDPNGKRKVLHTDKPFTKKNMPSWVIDMPKESAAARKKREAREAKQNAADADKAKDDAKDIQEASFLGTGEAGSSVETI